MITRTQILHGLSALVFVPVSGFVTVWVAKHFPGLPKFTPDQLQHLMYIGSSSALGLALHYLHNNAIWERLQAGFNTSAASTGKSGK